jgi:hypothetical protein
LDSCEATSGYAVSATTGAPSFAARQIDLFCMHQLSSVEDSQGVQIGGTARRGWVTAST